MWQLSLTHYVTVTCDLAGETFDGASDLVYLATTKVRSLFKYDDASDLKTTTPIEGAWEVELSRLGKFVRLPHTRELGLRIAWNFWGNDKYTDGFLILCELCGHIVKILGDQHGGRIQGDLI